MIEEKFLEILKKELVVALGCTEPIAIALAAATARKYLPSQEIASIKVFASRNIIKNAMSVNIPGTESCGINLAAALGAEVNYEFSKLEVLNRITKENIIKAKEMVKANMASVAIADTSKKLYIEVIINSGSSSSKVIIEDDHTNITTIEVDGKSYLGDMLRTAKLTDDENTDTLCIKEIWDFVQSVDIEKLAIIKQSITLNKAIALEGINSCYGLSVGKTIMDSIKKGILQEDILSYSMALTAAASDARMAGCSLSVMSNSGSGNQGIAATLPVVAAWEKLGLEEEKLIRAVALSHYITIYIKSKFGRLSALCGITIATTGASCGIVYLYGGNLQAITYSIQNMLGNVTGMLCDGAKAGCALKVSTCTNAAVQSAMLALNNINIKATDGIIEEDVEKTINNVCRLANEGTQTADDIILDIMINK